MLVAVHAGDGVLDLVADRLVGVGVGILDTRSLVAEFLSGALVGVAVDVAGMECQ